MADNNGQNHKRTTSSVLKGILPRHHKRNPSVGTTLPTTIGKPTELAGRQSSKALPSLLPDNPNTSRPLYEVNNNRERTRASSRKSVEIYADEERKTEGKHNRAKSAAVLTTLAGLNREGEKVVKSKVSEGDKERKPKKSKSSTNIVALLSRPKSSRSLRNGVDVPPKDKENQTPPNSASVAPPPIWAQFASQQLQELTTTQKIPLNDSWDVGEEVSRYTPQEYSPSKGRNFDDCEQPALVRRAEPKPRPKSAFLPSAPSTTSFMETLSGLRKKNPSVSSRKTSVETKSSHRQSLSDDEQPIKQGSRVMAAVAAWNGKLKESVMDTKPSKPNPQDIEAAFENLLDSRNIEQHLREKMRALDTNIKADFIKQHITGSASSIDDLTSKSTATAKPVLTHRSKTDSSESRDGLDSKATADLVNPKKSRPRSLTFTLSKSDRASLKKQKGERPTSRGRGKSIDISRASTTRNSSTDGSHALAHTSKATKALEPGEYVAYLRRAPSPQLVEVGKLQKLRQLLRNETVEWVDSFIVEGGMVEIVALLNKIINIEWREEHEDSLLHHTLNCLKALLSTSLAISHLSNIQTSLFPTLLQLLFSSGEEKKGPSEFATRNIIISLLFISLSSSGPSNLSSRARELLSYLRDPAPKVELPGFIVEMHRPRPYKIWCKEVTNVTKEVFWIFLHHLNVIPYPAIRPSADFASAHFPQARPPVPAAPYVGGVEWEATTYLATHLDLLNGVIAALPTREERNALRQELRDSGFEKVMGGSLRTCKEKFYSGVHTGLETWVGAAREDGWEVRDVKEGIPREEKRGRGPDSPKKKRDEAPRLEIAGLDIGGGVGVKIKEGKAGGKREGGTDDGGWL